MANHIQFELFCNEYTGLTEQFKVNPASCGGGNGFYEFYLKHGALDNKNSGSSITHILLETSMSGKNIIGYITLRASSINTNEHRGVASCFPAIEIVCMAVSKEYERRGYGKLLLDFVITSANILRRNYIGIEYIVACADKHAIGFYLKYGFNEIKEKLTDALLSKSSRQINTDVYLKLPSLSL